MILKSLRLATLVFIFLVGLKNCDADNDKPQQKYKILMLCPNCAKSHQVPFLALTKALAERGHHITFFSSLPSNLNDSNVVDIEHGVQFNDEMTMFEVNEADWTGYFVIFKDLLPTLAREIYKVPVVMDLYKRRKEFDLIIIDDQFNEFAYPFVEDTKFAAISVNGIVLQMSAVMGNVLNPSYIPSIITDFPRPYSFYQRVLSLCAHVLPALYWRKYLIYPEIEKELLKTFPDLSPLTEIEKGLSLVLTNTHFSMDLSIPVLPSQVPVGGMHCRPGKQLPKDLNSFIEESGNNGAIYFSLGSICQGKTVPEKYKKILIQAFGKLKQRVIWKFEVEIDDLPKNVMVSKWLPQQDILAHPKIKLFITHGGLMSSQEAMYHATPLLAIPVFADQFKNGQRILNKGIGKVLLWQELTVETLVSTIQEIISNPKYKNAIENISSAFRDQPFTPLETAVWWTEYAIRHKGAPQLKSPAADLSWIEFLMLDILFVLHVALFLLYWIVKKLLSVICSLIFNQKNSKKKKKKE